MRAVLTHGILHVVDMATDPLADLRDVLRDTVREAARSWRLPVALALGVGFGLIEWSHTNAVASLVFGPLAALYTLFLGPLPWRTLVPLEVDGQRFSKFWRGAMAAGIALVMFALLVIPYAWVSDVIEVRSAYMATHPREFVVSTLLFMVGGWGLARDVQLEQRLDRSLRSHGQLEAKLEEARHHALRADLDPHFLFNALNAIASQCASDPRLAEENIVRLSSLLRAVLDTRQRPRHALDDELALARDYLALLGARYPTLTYAIDVGAVPGDFLVPPMILQPLLENGVRHGRLTEGSIEVRGAVDPNDGTIVLEVRSPGRPGEAREGGMGVDLVRQRARLAWGERASFELKADGAFTLATLRIPPDTAAAPLSANRSAA